MKDKSTHGKENADTRQNENRNSYQADLFSNRLKKKYKETRKWARKNGITCFRLYDRDIPEIPLSLDVYEFLPEEIKTKSQAEKFLSVQNERISMNDLSAEQEAEKRRYAVLYLYERPYEKDASEEESWLNLMAISASYVLNIPVSHIVKKTRKMQKGLSQYEKNQSDSGIKGTVFEQGELFRIDLLTYLDTGLFLDHRPLRKQIREESEGKRILNLFCYTGSFSVYAASGKASFVESVDLSNTYLNWAEENMKLNGFSDKSKYRFTKADAVKWLSRQAEKSEEADSVPKKADISKGQRKFDIIILDPPTFSNSKSARNILDINRDWPELVEKCVKILEPGGTLYFSTNSGRLSFDEKKLPKNTDFIELTQNSIPKDFEGAKCHRLWKIRLY